MCLESSDFSPLPIDELKKYIPALLELIDRKSVSIDELKERLVPVFCGITMAAPFIQADRYLFRVVEWEEKPVHLRQLWCPPPEKLVTLGRANRQSQPMFYCSSSPAAAFLEVGAQPGKHYAVSIWKTRTRFPVNTAGYIEEVYTQSRTCKDIPDWVTTKESKWCNERNRLVVRFMREQFTKRVLPGQEHLYRMSIAIAEKQCEQDLFEGLMYPSIAAAARADNLAIKPSCAESRLEFIKAEYAVVEAIAEDKISLEVIDIANALSDAGTIRWLGGAPKWTIREDGQQLIFSVENRQWVARDISGKTVEPEMGPRAAILAFPEQHHDDSSSGSLSRDP
jgi:hypothetical protein